MIKIMYLHAGAEMYGADKVLLDLVRHLDKSRFKPIVVLPTEGVLVEAFQKEEINVKVLPYPIMRRKYFNPKGIIRYAYNYIKYTRKLTMIAQKEEINIIHTNTAAVLEGIYVSRKLKIPHLWAVHEIIVSPKFMFKLTSKLMSKFAKVIVADSLAVKDHLESSGFFKGNVQVVYNGIDVKRFHPDNDCNYLYKEWNIPQGTKIIGMMGRVNSMKGQGDFLEAASLIMQKHPDVYTIFIGDAFEGEEWREEALKQAVIKSKYKERIIVRGYRNDSEGIYKLFDVFVLPSTNPDPLPTVILEAMATGKPIVGYRHGGICEMVKEGYNGLLADVGNTEDLAAKIDVLLEEKYLQKEMGERSRERLLECFSIESYINNYSGIYEVLYEQ